MLPNVQTFSGAVANSNESKATNGGVIDTCALGSTGSAYASAVSSHANGVGSEIKTQAVSGVGVLPVTTISTQVLRHVSTTSVEASFGPIHASSVGGSASSGGHSTTTAVAAQIAHVYQNCTFTDRKEEKSIAPASLLSESRAVLITKLKNYYQTKSNLPGLLSDHEQPIAEVNLTIRDIVAPRTHIREEKESKAPKPEATALAHFEKMHVVNHPVAVAEMFDKGPGREGELENKPAKHLLVVGAPGVGKTTMSQYAAYQWSIGKLWSNKFDYLFWIPLRNLLQYPTDATAKLSLAHMIRRECFNNYRSISTAVIDDILNQAGSRTLLVLDGYDEVAHLLDTPHISIILREAFESEYCMLTSRPYQLPPSGAFQVDRKLENTGFTDSNIESYVVQYFKKCESPQPEKSQALLDFLKTNLSVWGTAHIPINLALICELWETETATYIAGDSKEEIKPAITSPFDAELSLTGLYQQKTIFLFKRYLEKRGIKTRGQLPDWVYEPEQCQLEMEFLSELAFEGLSKGQIIITKELQHAMLKKLKSKLNPNSQPFFDKILASGFLRAADSPLKEEIDRPHYFIHLTFQEYLAAYYLVRCFKKVSSSEESLKATEWLRTEKYNPRYQVVLGFMAGLLSLDADTNTALQQFWKALLSEPFDLTRIGHIRLMIRCLEESRDDSRIPYCLKLLDEIGKWVWASCGGNANMQNWVVPQLCGSSWVARQPSILTHLLAYNEKAETSAKTRIVYILGSLGSVAAIPSVISVLLKALSDEVAYLRSRAATILGQLGSTHAETTRVIKTLSIIALNDKDYAVRSSAAEALGELGSAAATHQVIEALCTLAAPNDEDDGFRNSAIEALGKLGSAAATPEVIEVLLTALGDEEGLIKCNAAYALGQLGSTHAETTRVIKILSIIALNDEDDDVRSSAADALVKLGVHGERTRVIEELPTTLCNKDYRVRRIAADVLRQLGSAAATPEVIAALSRALKNEDYDIRGIAAEALGELGSAAATREVIEALTIITLNDEDDDVKSRAVKALGELGSAAATPEVIAALSRALKNEDYDVRSRAVKALGELGSAAATRQVIEALSIALSDEEDDVRSRAADALVKLGIHGERTRVVEALSKALSDEDYDIKSRAAKALGELGSAAATHQVIEALCTLAAPNDEDDGFRNSAIEALGKLGSAAATREVIEALLTALGDKEDLIKRNAAYALGQLGSTHAETTRVIEALLVAFPNKDFQVKHSVIAALGKLGAHDGSIKTILTILQEEEDLLLLANIRADLRQWNIGQHLCTLDVKLLKTAVTKEIYFSATPLEAFIKIWLDSRLKPVAQAEANSTQHTVWLEIVAALAFYRAIPITLNGMAIRVQEGSATFIHLPVEHAPVLKGELIDAFAKQARQFKLPDEFYTALRKGEAPYPFESVLPARTAETTTLSNPGTAAAVSTETKALKQATAVASTTGRASSAPAKTASVIAKRGTAVFASVRSEPRPSTKQTSSATANLASNVLGAETKALKQNTAVARSTGATSVPAKVGSERTRSSTIFAPKRSVARLNVRNAAGITATGSRNGIEQPKTNKLVSCRKPHNVRASHNSPGTQEQSLQSSSAVMNRSKR